MSQPNPIPEPPFAGELRPVKTGSTLWGLATDDGAFVADAMTQAEAEYLAALHNRTLANPTR